MSGRPLSWRLAERWLLRRLPARAVDAVLGDLQDDYLARRRGGRVSAALWLWHESRAVARAYREHTGTQPRRRPMTGSSTAHELRMAWKAVRSRGWRAVFSVALLALAMAVNVTVFSAADAFVFRTVPYAEPETLAVLDAIDAGPFGGTTGFVGTRVLEGWRSRSDVFAAVHGYVIGERGAETVGDVTTRIYAASVTPGLLEMIGRRPAWGRDFAASDAVDGAPPVVIIGESLARRLFGAPHLAVGQSIATDRSRPTVIGVMPRAFRFPTAAEEIWWPLDLAGRSDFSSVRSLVRLAPDVSMESADARVRLDSPRIAESVGADVNRGQLLLRSLASTRANPGASTIFAVLLGAAACLLLIACANVVSLETAAVALRARQLAVQSALGASRGSLIRVVLAESLYLTLCCVAGAVLLAWWSVQVLDGQLTPAMRESLANPLDLDFRALGFMVVVAGGTGLVTALPVVWRVSRVSVLDALRDDARTMPVTRGAARVRQALMTGQVALTVLLLVGALLYIQTYENRIGLDKGFDASRLVTVQVSPLPSAPLRGEALEAVLMERLRTTPDLRAVSRTWTLPPATQFGGAARPTIDGETHDEVIILHMVDADPEFLALMGIELIEGAGLAAGRAEEEVVIDERFARRFWPGRSPIGSRFKLGSIGWGGANEFRIVGVSREIRADQLVSETGTNVHIAYKALGADSHPLSFVARLNEGFSLSALTSLVRATAEKSIVRVESLEERYRALEGDTRLAAGITGGFAVVALLVATAGIYAVMAFLVSGRRREIGIRMALGADRGAVRGMVFGSALRFVLAGTVIGLAAAAVASQAIASQLFGVAAIDPATYAGVALIVAATALLATWWPARRAAAVDPAVTLRSE